MSSKIWRLFLPFDVGYPPMREQEHCNAGYLFVSRSNKRIIKVVTEILSGLPAPSLVPYPAALICL